MRSKPRGLARAPGGRPGRGTGTAQLRLEAVELLDRLVKVGANAKRQVEIAVGHRRC